MTQFVFTRRFWPLFGANTLGAFADNTLRMATIVAVYAAFTAGGGGAFDLPWGLGEHAGSLVSVAFTLPVFIFSVIAGQLADKVHRHVLIRQLKVIELILMATAAVCFAMGNGPLLVLALFLMGTQSAFFSPVRNAVMPQYYEPQELIRANGYYNAALFVAVVTGLGLGGYFVNQEGGRVTVSVMLIAAAAIGALLARFTPEAASPGLEKINWNIPSVIVRQLGFVRGLKGLWYPMIGVAWFWMVGAAVLANLPNYVGEDLGGGDAEISIIQAIFAMGAGLGTMIAGIVGAKMKDSLFLAGAGVAGTVVGAGLIWGLTLGFDPSAGPLFSWANAPLLSALALTAAANGFFAVPLMTALQRRAPEAERARVMGTANMTNGLAATVGALFIPPLRSIGLSAADIFLVLAILQLSLLIFMWRRKRTFRAAAAEAEAAVAGR